MFTSHAELTKAGMLRKRITIIDSDREFCIAASAILRNSMKFQVNKVYHDSKEALKKLKDDLSDIIIMDLDFPELKGPDFILKAREKIPGLDVLVTTDYDDEQIVFQSLCHGASGYLLKKNCLSQLLDALSVMTSGGSPIDPVIARYVIRSIQINEISPLSSRESMVLKLLMQGKTYAVIAEELFISGETVKTHLKNIYRKLKVNTKAEAVRKAVEEQLVAGYMGLTFNYR
jgi:DNA-binding NarL/FixJ family response regulator